MSSVDARAEPASVLEVEGVTVSYGKVRALEALSFDVKRSGLILVLGPNGAGKSSLVRAIAGSIRNAGGRTRLEGRDLTTLPAFRRARLGISLVPEGRGTLPGLSVKDNLHLGWRGGRSGSRSLPSSEMQRVVDLFPLLGERMRQDCSTLSGGQMQMLAIARAMLANPAVMLLDEPSLGLSPQAVSIAYEALARLNRQGLPMVLVEQKAVPIWREPDSTIVLQAGRVLRHMKDSRPSDEELADLYLGALQ
jgi:branched-chain amino acid transport system ATP-binding protein